MSADYSKVSAPVTMLTQQTIAVHVDTHTHFINTGGVTLMTY